jgi:hypothetical protein
MNVKSLKFLNNKAFYIPVGLGVIYLLYNYFKNKHEVTSDVEECEAQLSYPIQWYKNKADSLHIAFGHAYDTTDENAIYSVYDALMNCEDFNALNVEFGTRTYADWIPFVYHEHNLEGYVQAELNETEKQIINDKLASIGVSYRY